MIPVVPTTPAKPAHGSSVDLIIVGGGLWGGLLAYRLARFQPEIRFLLLEQSSLLGGNHTWSFHEADLSAEDSQWILPLVTQSWKSYEVRFPKFVRVLKNSYHSVTSDKFGQIIEPALGESLVLEAEVESLSPTQVTLRDGTTLNAKVVLDARGEKKSTDFGEVNFKGYQKFVGLDVRTSKPHGLTHPILMDANCEQLDGYRFFYVLPWSEDTLLIEDTRYSDRPEIDVEAFKLEIAAYGRGQGWEIAEILRSEVGALPIPLAQAPATATTTAGSVASFGTRAGIFHETSGYSLPMAARFSRIVAKSALEAIPGALAKLSRDHVESSGFYCLLNRMIFKAARPTERYRILEHFYRLPGSTIQRFYSRQFDWLDKFRIFSSAQPPVPIHRAVGCFFE